MTQINKVTVFMVGLLVTILLMVYFYNSGESMILSVSPSEEMPVILRTSVIELGGTTENVASQNGDNCNDEEIIFMRTNYEDKDFLIDTCYNINLGTMRVVKVFK